MATLKLSKSITAKVKYLLAPSSDERRKGYHYKRLIPSDLQPFFRNKKGRILRNIYTRLSDNLELAIQQSEALTEAYDKEFEQLKLNNSRTSELPHERHLDIQTPIPSTTQHIAINAAALEYSKELFRNKPEQCLTDVYSNQRMHSLEQVLDWYLSVRTHASDKRRRKQVTTKLKSLMQFFPQGSITELNRSHFRSWVNFLYKEKQLKHVSVKSYVAQVSGVLRQYWHTHFDEPYPKMTSYLTSYTPQKSNNQEQAKVKVIACGDLPKVEILIRQKMGKFKNALIAGMLINTGCRVNEVAGLKKSDLHLDENIPHFEIRSNEARALKTANSTRLIPLVGLSLEAFRMALEQSDISSDYLFPTFIQADEELEGLRITSSASSMVNVWIKKHIGNYSSHSFRHTLAARAKVKRYSREQVEQLFGWSSKSDMYEVYGQISKLDEHRRMLLDITSVKSWEVLDNRSN